jgi:MFS family permease
MTQSVAEHKFEPPNGGYRAWITVLGSFLLQASSFGFVSACGVFQLYYKSVMLPERSSQELGWITTFAEFLIFGAGIPVGHLVDIYGPRPVIAPFAALGVICVGLLSQCTEYWQVLLCQGLGFGLACSGTTLPAVVCVTQWFSTRRGLAVGLASCGSSFGGLIYPIMMSRLLEQVGFEAALKWATLPVGFGMAIGVLCCEGPFPPKVKVGKPKNQDSENLTAQSFTSDSTTNISDVENGNSQFDHNEPKITPGALQAEATPKIPLIERFTSQVLGSFENNGLAWIFFCAGAFFCTFPVLAPYNYLPEQAVGGGMNKKLAEYSLAIMNASAMVGRVIPGYVSDFMGPFNVMGIVATTSAIAILAVWLPLNYLPNDGGIIFFAIFYGFVSGGYTSLLSPCCASLVDGKLDDLGLKFGITCLFLALG